MTSNISPGDWESLSAYIDYRLSESERNLLEGRLQAEPELLRALDEIRRIKAVAWYAPRRRAPRNFTLSPRQARARASAPLYPVFRMASVLASILFAMVLVGDFLTGVTTGVPIVARMAPPQSAEVQEMQLAMEAAAPAPMEAQEEPVEQPVDALSMAAEPTAQALADLPPAPFLSGEVPANQAAPYPLPTEPVAQEAAEEFGIGGGPAAKVAASETPMPTTTIVPTATLGPTVVPEAVILQDEPAEVQPTPVPTVQATPSLQPERELFTVPYFNRWVVWGVEGLLLALAGLALLAALFTRRLR